MNVIKIHNNTKAEEDTLLIINGYQEDLINYLTDLDVFKDEIDIIPTNYIDCTSEY
jgi:hypothetical protein